MSGDPASKNDDELLSQIDELKARMDRLMRGGSSTSNSALLTESDKAKAAESDRVSKDETAAPPVRTRVRDLIESEDTEVVEVYPRSKEVVPFPADMNPVSPTPKPSTPPKAAPPKPESRPPVRSSKPAVEGSLISLDESVSESRPQATTFDELGNAVQQELAKDSSVPPGAKKGPDLASRFGSVGDGSDSERQPVSEPKTVEPVIADDADQDEAAEVYDYEPDDDAAAVPAYAADTRRNPGGLVVAIWVFTALVSGAIATLHFTGAI